MHVLPLFSPFSASFYPPPYIIMVKNLHQRITVRCLEKDLLPPNGVFGFLLNQPDPL